MGAATRRFCLTKASVSLGTWRIVLALSTLLLAMLVLAARADAFVYWTNISTNTIGQAAIASNGNVLSVNQSFINGASDPTGVAVDDAAVYWTNSDANTIGQAHLASNGNVSNPNQSFLTGAREPFGATVHSTHLYCTNATTLTHGHS